MEEKNLPEISIADDFLIQMAEQAERRIDAVIKIKKIALKVCNPRDWTDQAGNPYLQTSGAEKIANLFNISWRIDEPIYEEDSDGHYTYSYKGFFSLGSRTTEAEGSRSSRDGFFKQYLYEEKERKEVSISERTNKRDVKMAALTNLLGNGITRILGIRNLTWDDLKEFAGITKEQVTSIQYKKGGEKAPVTMPQEKKANGEQSKEQGKIIVSLVDSVTQSSGKKKDGKEWVKYAVHIGDKKYSTFSKTIAEDAKQAGQSGVKATIEYKNTEFGPEIVTLKLEETREPGSEG
jgi:hypothetical protein